MSGVRHHFIPQFLQRGFATKRKSNQFSTCIYTKHSPTFCTNINNSGVEKLFYSIEKESELDDEITKLEDTYSEVIHFARNCDAQEVIDSNAIAKLIFNFEIRSNNIRSVFKDSIEMVINEINTRLTHPEIQNHLFNKIINEEVELAINKHMEEAGIPRSMFPLYQYQVKNEYKDELIQGIQKVKDEMPERIAELSSTLLKNLKKLVKDAHIKALLKVQKTNPTKQKKYYDLTYTIHEFDQSELPLGDSILIFHIEGNRSYVNFLEEKHILKAVILPIATNRVIVGSTNDNYDPNYAEIKDAIIKNSREFFIFKEKNLELEELKCAISNNAFFLTENEVKKLISSSS